MTKDSRSSIHSKVLDAPLPVRAPAMAEAGAAGGVARAGWSAMAARARAGFSVRRALRRQAWLKSLRGGRALGLVVLLDFGIARGADPKVRQVGGRPVVPPHCLGLDSGSANGSNSQDTLPRVACTHDGQPPGPYERVGLGCGVPYSSGVSSSRLCRFWNLTTSTSQKLAATLITPGAVCMATLSC